MSNCTIVWYNCCSDAIIVPYDVTIIVRWQLSTKSEHDYLFCFCPLVGILFEVLRILCEVTHHLQWTYSNTLIASPLPDNVYECSYYMQIISFLTTLIIRETYHNPFLNIILLPAPCIQCNSPWFLISLLGWNTLLLPDNEIHGITVKLIKWIQRKDCFATLISQTVSMLRTCTFSVPTGHVDLILHGTCKKNHFLLNTIQIMLYLILQRHRHVTI